MTFLINKRGGTAAFPKSFKVFGEKRLMNTDLPHFFPIYQVIYGLEPYGVTATHSITAVLAL